MTVWDCVIRLCDPRLTVNSGQGRLSPTGVSCPGSGGWPGQSVPGAERAGERSAEPRGATGSSLSHRTAASLLHETTHGPRLKRKHAASSYLDFRRAQL